MILSMKQGQQQKQKLTQEQSFFLDILKFNKEELMDYLEKEYQENPLIDFDRAFLIKKVYLLRRICQISKTMP